MQPHQGGAQNLAGAWDRVIVVTGMGRSGTRFLSTLINHARNAAARHELIGDTAFAALSYYNAAHPLVSTKMQAGFRRFMTEVPTADRYVAVEPGLRYAVPVVRNLSPQPNCWHLVRNGRAVVQSMQRRKFLTDRDPHLPCMPFDAAEFERWQRSDRFGRLCWYWTDSVSRLLQQGVRTLHLEQLVSDYDYLDEQLLQPAGIALPKSAWIQERDRRVNRSGWRLRLKALIGRRPRSESWSREHERTFREVCGDVMGTLNYA
ncbi:MAG: hypothetical protein AB7I48_25445 [Planctomycetaceae bacterium]